jgi:hypothetical protein
LTLGAQSGLDFDHFVLQPLGGPQLAENTRLVIEYCMAHPRWRIGVQWHKERVSVQATNHNRRTLVEREVLRGRRRL